MYSRRKDFTTKDEVVVSRDTRNCVIGWKRNKIQMDRYGHKVVMDMNSMVDELEIISRQIAYRHNQNNEDYHLETGDLWALLIELETMP